MQQKPLIKRYLPNTLFGRALLIMIVPAVLVQLVLVYQFYERHWDSVVRHMSTSLAGEVEVLYRAYHEMPLERVKEKGEILGINVSLDRGKTTVFEAGRGAEDHPDFFYQLAERLSMPFMVEQRGRDDDLVISLLTEDGTLRLSMTKKRLVSSTTYIFLLWSIGSSLVLLIVATIFLRNQIRPIRLLAQAAERFGLGQDEEEFRPRGAAEVRQAGRAFVIMRNRIQRQVKTRTEMLAGISHDLRTPLTRMKLQLAMLPLKEKQQKELSGDIEEMEHMINEYLQFARGQGLEEVGAVVLDDMIAELVSDYHRQQQPVELKADSGVTLNIRPKSMRRALQNVIDNALRYGKEALVTTERDGAYVVISVLDKGPGIPEETKETVFRPFTRLDPARNQDTSGAGLGLTISRDIVQAHGGTVELRNHKKGLQVLINLPCDYAEEATNKKGLA